MVLVLHSLTEPVCRLHFTMVQVSTVKSCLEGWREPVIHLDALLGWEKDFYPAITAGVLTLKFIFYWYWDPTLITFIAFLGLCLTLCDFIGPKILGQVSIILTSIMSLRVETKPW